MGSMPDSDSLVFQAVIVLSVLISHKNLFLKEGSIKKENGGWFCVEPSIPKLNYPLKRIHVVSKLKYTL